MKKRCLLGCWQQGLRERFQTDRLSSDPPSWRVFSCPKEGLAIIKRFEGQTWAHKSWATARIEQLIET